MREPQLLVCFFFLVVWQITRPLLLESKLQALACESGVLLPPLCPQISSHILVYGDQYCTDYVQLLLLLPVSPADFFSGVLRNRCHLGKKQQIFPLFVQCPTMGRGQATQPKGDSCGIQALLPTLFSLKELVRILNGLLSGEAVISEKYRSCLNTYEIINVRIVDTLLCTIAADSRSLSELLTYTN